MAFARRVLGALIVALAAMVGGAQAQSVDVGGRVYMDYFYNVSDPNPDVEGLNGFQYRRLYLTTDYKLSEEFSGRARLEAPEDIGGVSGVKVKDLSITWNYTGEHTATVGVTPPPAFGIAEDFWGYRSLSKVVMDLQGIANSRDFGLRVDGPLLGDGTLRYAAMVANNSNTAFEEANDYKRVYGQLRARPTDRLLFAVGADYQGAADSSGTRASVLAGYTAESFRVGVDAYWYQSSQTGDDVTDLGASLFGIVQVASAWDVIGRVDRTRESGIGADAYDTRFVGGVAYQPHDNVKLIPNLIYQAPDQGDGRTTGRFTAEIHF